MASARSAPSSTFIQSEPCATLFARARAEKCARPARHEQEIPRPKYHAAVTHVNRAHTASSNTRLTPVSHKRMADRVSLRTEPRCPAAQRVGQCGQVTSALVQSRALLATEALRVLTLLQVACVVKGRIGCARGSRFLAAVVRPGKALPSPATRSPTAVCRQGDLSGEDCAGPHVSIHSATINLSR